MNKVRGLGLAALIFALAIFIAACSTTPPVPAMPEIPATPNGPDLSGHWVVTTQSQMGAQDSDMTVKQTGEALAGTLTSQMGSVDYTGTVQGAAIAFGFDIEVQGNSLRFDYSGTVEGDTMKGKAVFGPLGEGLFIARRKAP